MKRQIVSLQLKLGFKVLLILIGIFLFSCSKVERKEYVFCKSNCINFKCKILHYNTFDAYPNFMVRINIVKKVSGFFNFNNVVAYYTTDSKGEFTADIPFVDFNNYKITIEDTTSNHFSLAQLSSIPDTTTILFR